MAQVKNIALKADAFNAMLIEIEDRNLPVSRSLLDRMVQLVKEHNLEKDSSGILERVKKLYKHLE
jgi:hypothetical protein